MHGRVEYIFWSQLIYGYRGIYIAFYIKGIINKTKNIWFRARNNVVWNQT